MDKIQSRECRLRLLQRGQRRERVGKVYSVHQGHEDLWGNNWIQKACAKIVDTSLLGLGMSRDKMRTSMILCFSWINHNICYALNYCTKNKAIETSQGNSGMNCSDTKAYKHRMSPFCHSCNTPYLTKLYCCLTTSVTSCQGHLRFAYYFVFLKPQSVSILYQI